MAKDISAEKAHATYSASGSHRWLNCPGSIALCEKAPPQRESAYATEGTEAHACLEFLLKNRNNLRDAVRVVRKKYDDEMVGHALEAAEWIIARLAAAPGAEFLCETKVDASPFTCNEQFGTLDAAIAHEFGRLIVIDYKYGAGVAVHPDGHDGMGNSQLVYYALGISHAYYHNFAEVELVVIQPRAYTASGETIRSHVLSMEDLAAWEHRFREGVTVSKLPNAPLAAGAWCKFCPAAAICPELKDNAMRDAQVVFADETGLVSVPEPKMIVVPHLGNILDACERLEAWIDKVREHAVHVLERGGTIDGFKLVDKRAPRKWVDEDRIASEASAALGPAAFSPPKLLSPAQLEKQFKHNKSIGSWVEARVTTKSSGTTLVRESDRRPPARLIKDIFGEPVNTIE